MGNYRFRLSDMIPNAWFYKLKDMNKSRNQQKIVYHHHVSKKKPHHTSSSSSSFSSSSSSSSSLSFKERQQQQQLSHQRKSYYFSRDLSTTTAPAAAPPGAELDNAETKTTRISDGKSSSSSKKRRSGARRNRVSNRVVTTTTTSSVATAGGCSCRATVESVWSKPDSTTPEEYPISPLDTTSSSSSSDENEAFTLPEFGSNNMNMNMPCFAPEKFDTMLSWSSTTYCPGSKLGKKDTGNEPFIAKFQEPADDKRNGIGIDTISQFNLPPIITNHQSSKTTSKKMESLTLANTTVEEEEEPTKIRRDYGGLATGRRFSSGNYSSQGLKLRTNTPRIVNRRRIQLQGRKSVSKPRSRKSMSESFAVVKSSKDPQRDFRDSMLEMIIENNLCASKDLEDLLACYLSLNSDEYHDLIITVFKQIWFDIIDIHPN